MAQRHDKSIGSREIIAIFVFCLVLKATDTTPTLMFKAGYTAGWMVTLFSAIIMAGPIFIIIHLVSRHKDINLIEIIYKLMGKYVGFIFSFILFYILFSSLVYNSRSYMDIMSAIFYPKTPMMILYSSLLIVIYIMGRLGISAIGRAAWINFFTIKVVFIALVIFSQKDINFGYIFPLEGPGIVKLLKSSLPISSIWLDVFYITMLCPVVTNKKNFKKASLFAFALSVVEVTITMVVYIITFGYPSIVYLNYPFQELTRGARFGSYFTKPEAFYLGFWSVAATIRYAVYLYLVASILQYMLKLKDYKPLLPVLAAWVLALGMMPENFIINIFVVRENLLGWAWIPGILIPVVLLIFDKIRGNYAK